MMANRYRSRVLVAGVLGALWVATGVATAQTPEPAAGPVTVYERTEEDKKPERTAAEFDIPMRERSRAALADDKREMQIITLQELIEMKDDSDPEKPELLVRMADLYWEKAEAFEDKARDTSVDELLQKALDAGDTQTYQRLQRERAAYFDKQRLWQEKTIELYQAVEARYPTYTGMDMVLYYLGYNLNQLERSDEALQYFVKLATEYPESRFLPDALFNVGDYYFENNEFSKALVFFDKVANFQDSPVFGFALYKQGWCYYNMGEYDRAFQSFLAVVRYTDAAVAQGQELPIRLKKEALKDLVLTYSQVGAPGKAVAFFRDIAPDTYLELSAELAELYSDQGKFDESNELLQRIISEDPDSYRVLTYQRIIVQNADKRGKKETTAREAERLIGLYRKLSATAPPDYVAKEQSRVDELIRSMATTYHAEYEKTKREDALRLSERLYGVYVGLFPDSDKAYVMHRNYGVLLYQLEKYDKAVVEFEKVIELDPKGPYSNEAAYTALLCYYKLINLGSAEAKSPDSTELAPKEIPELHAKMINACDRYVRIAGGEGEDVPAAKFAAAKIYYDFNQFDEAIPRFKDLVANHEHQEAARDAARLLLSSFNLAHDIRSLNRWAEILSKRPHLMSGDLAVIIRRIRDRAEYNRCFQFEQDKRYKRAADCFIGYVEKFPSTELMDKALYNAALNYDRANRMERAIETFVDLYNRAPKSPLAPRSLFAVGKVYHNAAVYSEASRYYEIYADRHPKDDYVEEALRYASIFRKSLGDYDKAVDNLKRYLKLFPKHERAPNIFFDIGLIYEKKKDWEETADHFRAYLKKYSKRGPLDLKLIAELKIAKAHLLFRRERDREKGYEELGELVKEFNTLSKDELAKLTPAGVSAVAEARFIEGERVLARARDIQITQKNITEATVQKLQVISDATKIFEDVYTFEHPHWQIAALNRAGMAYVDLAESIEKSPCPKELNSMQCEIYKQDLAIKADQIRQQAITFFRKCLETAKTQQWFNEFSDEAEQQLAQIDYTFRFTHEYRARPVHTRAQAYPSSFMFAEDETDREEAETP